MFTFFRKKNNSETNDRLDPEIREDGLRKGRALREVMDDYFITRKYDDELDGTNNKTGYDWYIMKKNVNKKDALEKLASLTEWMLQNDMYGFKCDNHYFFRLNGKTAVILDKFTQEDEALLPFCKEHHIDLFVIDNGSYVKCETKEKFCLNVSTYPGSADDAATYGDVELIKEKEL
ncbi:MAG: hypothetical protein IKR11_09840 [Solobacterium sp.]|nr:hypothetical protein [Solobacterium sp.]